VQLLQSSERAGSFASDTGSCWRLYEKYIYKTQKSRLFSIPELLSQEREKALEAQADLLAVSAGQLEACVALGRAAVASEDAGRLKDAAQTVKVMEGLLAVPTRLCTGTRSAVLCNLPAAVAGLEGGTRFQHFELDAARCSVSVDSLTTFVKGEAARNVLRVTCIDCDGELADWATLEDADVSMTVNGAAWQAASAVLARPGVVEVTYAVEEGLEEVEVVPGGPWLDLMVKGVHTATLKLPPESFNPFVTAVWTLSNASAFSGRISKKRANSLAPS